MCVYCVGLTFNNADDKTITLINGEGQQQQYTSQGATSQDIFEFRCAFALDICPVQTRNGEYKITVQIGEDTYEIVATVEGYEPPVIGNEKQVITANFLDGYFDKVINKEFTSLKTRVETLEAKVAALEGSS